MTVCCNNTTIHPDCAEVERVSSVSVSFTRTSFSCGDTATGANVPESATNRCPSSGVSGRPEDPEMLEQLDLLSQLQAQQCKYNTSCT